MNNFIRIIFGRDSENRNSFRSLQVHLLSAGPRRERSADVIAPRSAVTDVAKDLDNFLFASRFGFSLITTRSLDVQM